MAKQQNDDAIIHLETYTQNGGLIVTKAPGEKTFVGRAYCMSALSGGGGEFNTVVQNIFKSTPDDSIIQCTMVCAPDHAAPQRYAGTKDKGGALVSELVQRQAKILQDGLTIGWQPDVPLINTRKVIITLSVPVKGTDAQTMADNLALQSEFLNGLKGCGFYDVQPISPGDLLGWYRVFANIFEPHKTVALDDQIELKYQAFGADTVIDFTDRAVGKIGSVYMAGVAVKQYPEQEISHGIMSLATGAPFNHGTTHEGGGQRILTPFLFNTTIRVANQQKENDRVAKAIESRMHENTLPFRLGNEDPAQKLKDLKLIKQMCASDGDKYVNVTTTAFLFSLQKEQAQDAAVTLKGTLNKLGFDARETRINTHIRWAQTLPLNFSTKVASQLKSDGMMYSSAVGALMPILGDNPGLSFLAGATHTGSAFITRRGTVHYFDPFVSDNNYSGVIAASPGSGKSFLLQKRIQDDLAEGGYVFLIESGASTKKFCNAAGGEFNEFSLVEPNQPSLNPFTGLSQKEFDEQQETITALLLLMSYEGESMQAGARIAMAEAVRAAYAQNEHTTEIRHVVQALQTTATSSNDHPTEVQSAAANLVPRLNAFLVSPSRGQFFQGAGTVNPTKHFTVFELGGLAGDLHLFKCVTFFVLNLLLSRIRKLPGARKCVYVDEAHDVFKDPLADKVMEGLYLKGRKEKVSIFCIVQSLLKMAKEGAGQVILNSSAWKILLAQKPEEVDQLFSTGTLKQWADDDFYRRSVKDVETRKGVYSELLISGDRYYETVRLYVDKFTAALYSSEGDERDAVFQLMRSGMSAVDAVLQVMGDKRLSHLAQIKRTVQFLKDLDPDLSPSDIISMTHEAVYA